MLLANSEVAFPVIIVVAVILIATFSIAFGQSLQHLDRRRAGIDFCCAFGVLSIICLVYLFVRFFVFGELAVEERFMFGIAVTELLAALILYYPNAEEYRNSVGRNDDMSNPPGRSQIRALLSLAVFGIILYGGFGIAFWTMISTDNRSLDRTPPHSEPEVIEVEVLETESEQPEPNGNDEGPKKERKKDEDAKTAPSDSPIETLLD